METLNRSTDRTPCVDPATGEVFGYSELTTVEELKAAVAKARLAQPEWARRSVRQRAESLVPVRDHIVGHAEEIAAIISRDNGKTRMDAMTTEVVPTAMALSYYARKARTFLRPRRLAPGSLLLANKSSRVVRVPWGVVGVISPWNYPFAIPFSEVVMALLAGNAVILKTASETQAVGRALEECIRAARLPERLFSFVNIPGKVAGAAMLEAGVNKLFFTGSVPVGKALMAKASETLTPLSLELGGNDAMLVCEDADLERAASGAVWAGMQNAGQSCGGVERIYVHEKVYEPFLALLKAKVEVLRVGKDTDFQVDMGAMTTKRQLETVRRHVEDAVSKGAAVYARSGAPSGGEGLFHPAVVLTEVTHDMVTMREETFGPVVGVMKVRDMDEAVRLANDSDLGLTASVWSTSSRTADEIARRIEAGAVTINDHLMSHGLAETPWGGFKQSALGRTHGSIGFDEMTQPQVIVHDIMPGVRKDLWWHPHSQEVYAGMKGFIDFLYARPVGTRLRGALKLLKVFPRAFKAD